MRSYEEINKEIAEFFNPYHDKLGRFTFKPGGGSSGGGSPTSSRDRLGAHADTVNIDKDIPEEKLKTISDAFDEVLGKYGIKLDEFSTPDTHSFNGVCNPDFYKAHVSSIGISKNFINKPDSQIRSDAENAFKASKQKTTIFIRGDRSKTPGQKAEELKKLSETKRWSISSSSENPLKSTAYHECGHAILQNNPGLEHKFSQSLKETGGIKDLHKVSEYASSAHNEAFSEITAAVFSGRSNLVPKSVMKAYEVTMNGI